MCALYGHSLPYAARALACVVLGMAVSNGVGLATAAATSSTAVRVAVAARFAAAHKLVRPPRSTPGDVVCTLVATNCAFSTALRRHPYHLALPLAAGLLALMVRMAPGLVPPQERIVWRWQGPWTPPCSSLTPRMTTPPCRAAGATAAEAWRTVSSVGVRSLERQTLALLLARTESSSAGPQELTHWATLLRGTAPLPALLLPCPRNDQVTGATTASSAACNRPCNVGLLRRCHVRQPSVLRPGSMLAASWPAGPSWHWASAARTGPWPPPPRSSSPTWPSPGNAPSTGFSANFVGLALFAALLPITRAGSLTLVLAVLFFQAATKATISRGYRLGQVCGRQRVGDLGAPMPAAGGKRPAPGRENSLGACPTVPAKPLHGTPSSVTIHRMETPGRVPGGEEKRSMRRTRTPCCAA